jgi:DNA-binding MarR family transcriptional regulator
MNTAKKQVQTGITQFELTQKLITNLQQFNLTPTAKLVLIYLSSCYNPKHSEIFPKQSTIAEKLGVSEASVIRAISEAHKEGLIISERKYTNRYKITAKFLNLCGIVEHSNKMQPVTSQKERKQSCNLQPVLIEPKKEQIKQPINVEDFKILKKYAISHNARNIQAYINHLITSGSAKDILQEHKRIQNRIKNAGKVLKMLEEDKKFVEANQTELQQNFFLDVKNKIKSLQETRINQIRK